MGRGLITLADIHTPSPIILVADKLAQLVDGQKIQFTFSQYVRNDGCKIYRSISVRADDIPSSIQNGITYRIISTNIEPCINRINLRAISIIEVDHEDPSHHMNAFYITTDGYVRESEHFGIFAKIDDVIVVE